MTTPTLFDRVVAALSQQPASTTAPVGGHELTTEVLNRIESAILDVLGASGILQPGASFFHAKGQQIADFIVANINSTLAKHDVTFVDLQGAAKLAGITLPPTSDSKGFGRALFALKDAIPKLPPIGPAPTLGGTSTGATTFTPLSVPTGQFLKLRFANTQWAGTPSSGPTQPDQEIVNSVNLATDETNVSYRWEGFINFDAADYDFTAFATNGIRVTVAGDKVIDDVVISSERGITQRKTMPAGSTLVVVDWFNPSGPGTINLQITKVPAKSWKSCADGVTRSGDPPQGWVLTADGCWKAPLDSSTNAGIDLSKVVQISPSPETKIERAYLLGSGLAQTPYTLTFFNCSTNMGVIVELSGPDIVDFRSSFQTVGNVGVGGLPASKFVLAPRQQMLVDIIFKTDRMEALPEGINASQIFVKLSAGSITIPTNKDGTIELGLCPGLTPTSAPTSSVSPNKPQVELPVPQWADCSSGTRVQRTGTPPAGWVLRSDGCYVPPPPAVPQVTLDFTFSQLPSTLQTTVSGLIGGYVGQPVLHATLAAVVQGDDPTTFTYAWNFDVAGQGAGSGQTTVASPTNVAWLATAADQTALRNGGTTTRTIEVIATKGSMVLRARKQVMFRNNLDSLVGTSTGGSTTVTGGGGGSTISSRTPQLL
jgi:hypothetical protein